MEAPLLVAALVLMSSTLAASGKQSSGLFLTLLNHLFLDFFVLASKITEAPSFLFRKVDF
jgi:membrane-bound metal-dependent hydrolase YbcI (DUF457 family)